MLKGSVLSLAISVVHTTPDLLIFVVRSIPMDCVRIAVIIRRGRSDWSVGAWEMGGRGDGETGGRGDWLALSGAVGVASAFAEVETGLH